MEAYVRSDSSPFLSIITRTQGRRPHTLVEVLTCLTAQTDTDFELLILGHRLDAEGRAVVDRAIADTPGWMRERIRQIDVNEGNRTRPLNVGFEAALGEYVAVLDDDDAVFGHWVETFHDLARANGGKVLRALAVLQSVDTVTIREAPGLRAEGSPEAFYPARFDFFDHMLENRSPPVSVAIPRQAFHDMGVRYDETLTTTEDWDFFMRCISVSGIGNAPEITSIYRWWGVGESSRTVHKNNEWVANHHKIWDKWDAGPFGMPAGNVRPLIEVLEQRERFRAELRRLSDGGVRVDIPKSMLEPVGWLTPNRARAQVQHILESTSWRVSAPLRALQALLGISYRDELARVGSMTADEADLLAIRLRRSISWRVTAPLRQLSLMRIRYRETARK
jgi:hypothetical protein